MELGLDIAPKAEEIQKVFKVEGCFKGGDTGLQINLNFGQRRLGWCPVVCVRKCGIAVGRRQQRGECLCIPSACCHIFLHGDVL